MRSRTLQAPALGLTMALLVTPLLAQGRQVVVNQVVLTSTQVTAFEQRWQVSIRDGRYWYDRLSGAWGMDGGPTAGWIMPGLDLGGPLRADASRGRTGVFINGRELHDADVLALNQLLPVQRGRWWVDGQGNFGADQGPVLGNLWVIARQRGKQPGKAWSLYANGGNNFVAGDENGCSYFSSRDMGNGTSTSWASPGC